MNDAPQVNNWIIWVVLGVVVVALIGIVFVSKAPAGGLILGDPAEIVETDWVKGNPDAAVTLLEYGDFQCPACAQFHSIIPQVEDEFGDKLRIVYRHFPLSIHEHAMKASIVAEAAGKQGKFWEMQDVLYQKQREWSDSDSTEQLFLDYAKVLGLDVDQFLLDIDDPALKAKVERDAQTGNKLEIQSTPSFFLNGELMEDVGDLNNFLGQIESAVNASERGESVEEEAYADIKVFINGKALAINDTAPKGQITFADNSGEVLRKTWSTATLGDFFKGLGMTFDRDCLNTAEKEYCNDVTSGFIYFVNGEKKRSLHDYAFADGDQILISYGSPSRVAPKAELDAVTSKACTFTDTCE